MEDSQEEIEEDVSWVDKTRSDGSSKSTNDTMILMSQKGRKRRRNFDIQSLSEEEGEDKRIKGQRTEEIRNWSDEDAEEGSVINLISMDHEEEDQENEENSSKKEESRPRKEEENESGHS